MATEHDVKDLSQAEGGRYRIDWAEHEMPVLRAIKELQAMIERTRPRPIAIADRQYPQSEELL